MRPRTLTWLLCLAALVASAHAKPVGERQEVQSHGVYFEKWVRDTFSDGYEPPNYTQKWDIPASANKQYGGIPVNPKATKYGTPVDLGDALRQFAVDEPFLLIIGYWQQEGTQKRFVNLVAARVTPEQWAALWAPITLDDLKRLDAVVKDHRLSLADARAQARQIKSAPPFSKAVMVVNPKIDKSQRRLQCSLRFEAVFARLAPQVGSGVQQNPTLFGVPAPPPFESRPREFKANK